MSSIQGLGAHLPSPSSPSHTLTFSQELLLPTPNSGHVPLPQHSLMQNSSPDDSEVLEDTEIRQAVWPRSNVQVTCRRRGRLCG